MGAFDRSEQDASRRRGGSVAASLAVHALLLLLIDPIPEPPPDPPVMEVALVAFGSPDKPPASAPTPTPPTDTPPRPRPAPVPRPLPLAPKGTQVAAVTPPEIEPVPPAPPAPLSPPAPMSFRDWQRQQRSRFLPSRAATGGGSPEGTDAVSRRGRNRCDPPQGRRADVVYLLFDTSGSMNSIMKSQALTCAHQYAQAAIDAGGTVVVGNFARGSTISAPTRDMLDIEFALRGASDSRATILPTKELQPYLDSNPQAVSDLVIISDGWFVGSREVKTWYRYFLDLNPENRGTMFTVGTPGLREGVAGMRSLGFDVYMYEQISRR